VPGKWLFVTNQKDLVANAAQRFAKRISEPIGVIAEGRCSYERITVATFQSIAARILRGDREMLQLLTEVVGIIVDECHSAAAKTINHVLMQCNAYYRIGLSATPLDRTDKRSHYAIGALGPIIHELTAGEAHELGVVALPEIIMLDMEQESGLPTWQGVYGECIVRSGPRNRLLASAVLRAEKPCLLFVKEIRHGRFLEERLLKAKQRVGFVWGNDSMDGRDRAVERLERGDIDTLICSTIFQQGRDIPSLRSVVVGSGGKSLIAALQRIGRGMRTDGGRKASFQVWDIADRGNQWREHHAKARVKAYRREGYDVRFESTQHGPLFDSFPDRTP
jgi:superfamily II DNA or RNA helicase